MSEHHVAVIGAGPAGIATALSLQKYGVRPLVIDRAAEVGWCAAHHDGGLWSRDQCTADQYERRCGENHRARSVQVKKPQHQQACKHNQESAD